MMGNFYPIVSYCAQQLFQVSVFLVCAYYIIIHLMSLPFKYQTPYFHPSKRFALIVAAHNEEKVIGSLLDSLRMLHYPKHLYDIFVIADNCSDRTASIARKKNALVFERFDAQKKGKGYALEYIFEKLLAMENQYDAIAIFDADNIVSQNFLTHMNNELCAGKKVIQGYIESKNPFDSWITCAYSICFWTLSRFYQLPRHRLNLSCNLWGTGFVVDMDVLKSIGWDTHCLTEDLEFTIKLILNNYKVAWSEHAVVYDEKPLTLYESWQQRKRWMQGHADVGSRYLCRLFLKAFKDKNWSAFDCALYFLQTIRIAALVMALAMAYLQIQYPYGIIGKMHMYYLFPNAWMWILLLFFQILCPPLLILVERKFDWRIILGYLAYPIYNLTYVVIALQGFMDRNKKDWVHTVHRRNIRVEELEL